jgi:Holliday junction resolvase RusA-like endonuclease
MRVYLVIPGVPVPLQRSKTSHGRHYLPPRSREFRALVQSSWLEAGRPRLGSAPFACSMRFYGARGNADLDNLTKATLDALNGLAFGDDCQAVCFAGIHKLPVDVEGARSVIELWAV